MIDQFIRNIERLCDSSSGNHHFLLAVSGGIDSMVMANLFYKSKLNCTIAHCNFGLRGDESDRDEKFVEQLAAHYGFPFFSRKFDTETFAADNQISIQMAARKLRYGFFEELLQKKKLSKIVVGHNANDVAETMLLNLTRGAGLAGMHGIKEVNGNIIRPLLIFNRSEIIEFANLNSLSWREDASNSIDYYSRNKIRNKVLPHLEELNPKVVDSFNKHAQLMRSYENLLFQLFQKDEFSILSSHYDDAMFTIDVQKLNLLPEPQLILYHLLMKFNFSEEVLNSVLHSKQGAEFLSEEYKMIKGRDELSVFNSAKLFHDEEMFIGETDKYISLRFGSLSVSEVLSLSASQAHQNNDFADSNVAYLDARLLHYPLKLRRWIEGDFFYPLGSTGKKLLSDFFVDQKFSPIQKETTYLLLSGNEIVWVAGYRIDNRFKITESTKTIRKFNFNKTN